MFSPIGLFIERLFKFEDFSLTFQFNQEMRLSKTWRHFLLIYRPYLYLFYISQFSWTHIAVTHNTGSLSFIIYGSNPLFITALIICWHFISQKQGCIYSTTLVHYILSILQRSISWVALKSSFFLIFLTCL